MDNRSVRIAAVLASVAAVVSVVALLVTTYLSAKPQEVMTPEQTSVEGTPEPAGALRSPATSTAPVQGPAHDDEVAYVPDERTKAAILEVTVRYLTVWTRPGTPDERRERIRPYATVSRWSSVVMRKPETTKKTSTPRKPPGSQAGSRW